MISNSVIEQHHKAPPSTSQPHNLTSYDLVSSYMYVRNA